MARCGQVWSWQQRLNDWQQSFIRCGQVSLGAVRRGQVGYGMAHLAGGQLATVGLPVGVVGRGTARYGVVW